MALIEIKNNGYNNYFIKSEDIHVYPCSYRGNKDRQVFDPESRLFTEYNLIHSSTTYMPSDKEIYVIQWPTVSVEELKVVIKGYYFEIKNITLNDLANKFIWIRLTGASDQPRLARLGSCYWEQLGNDPISGASIRGYEDNYLDTKAGSNNDDIFTGLCLATVETAEAIPSGISSFGPIVSGSKNPVMSFSVPKVNSSAEVYNGVEIDNLNVSNALLIGNSSQIYNFSNPNYTKISSSRIEIGDSNTNQLNLGDSTATQNTYLKGKHIYIKGGQTINLTGENSTTDIKLEGKDITINGQNSTKIQPTNSTGKIIIASQNENKKIEITNDSTSITGGINVGGTITVVSGNINVSGSIFSTNATVTTRPQNPMDVVRKQELDTVNGTLASMGNGLAELQNEVATVEATYAPLSSITMLDNKYTAEVTGINNRLDNLGFKSGGIIISSSSYVSGGRFYKMGKMFCGTIELDNTTYKKDTGTKICRLQNWAELKNNITLNYSLKVGTAHGYAIYSAVKIKLVINGSTIEVYHSATNEYGGSSSLTPKIYLTWFIQNNTQTVVTAMMSDVDVFDGYTVE